MDVPEFLKTPPVFLPLNEYDVSDFVEEYKKYLAKETRVKHYQIYRDAKRDIKSGKYKKARCKLTALTIMDNNFMLWGCFNYYLGVVYSQLFSDTEATKQYFEIALNERTDILKYKMGFNAMNINKLKIILQLCWNNYGQELADVYSELINIDEYLARGFDPHFPELVRQGYDTDNLENNSGESDPNLILQTNTFISDSFNLETLYVRIGNLKNAIYNDGEWLLIIKFDTKGDEFKIISVQFHTKIIHPLVDKQGFITKSTFYDFLTQNPCLHQLIARIKSLLNNNIGNIDDTKIKKQIKKFANPDKIEEIIDNMNLISIFVVRKQLYTFITDYQSNNYDLFEMKLIIEMIVKHLFDIDDEKRKKISMMMRNPIDDIDNIEEKEEMEKKDPIEKINNVVCMYLFINHSVTGQLSLLKKRKALNEFKKIFYQLTGHKWHQKRYWKHRYDTPKEI